LLWHKFEASSCASPTTRSTPAILPCCQADGVLEMHEVKGFWQDDARVKIKVAASIYPFRFVAVTARAKKHGGGWEREEFSR
jgi:hypothetical protein